MCVGNFGSSTVSHEADIGLDAVYAIAKQQRLWGRSQAVEFAGTVKEILGTCHSLGITVDGTMTSVVHFIHSFIH